MSPDKLRKLIGLLGQLGHDNENIRASAGAAADKLVKSEGATWESLLSQPTGSPNRFWEQSAPPPPEPPPRSLDEAILFVLRQYAKTAWEKNFVASLEERYASYGSRTRVSEKQWAIIDRILGD